MDRVLSDSRSSAAMSSSAGIRQAASSAAAGDSEAGPTRRGLRSSDPPLPVGASRRKRSVPVREPAGVPTASEDDKG